MSKIQVHNCETLVDVARMFQQDTERFEKHRVNDENVNDVHRIISRVVRGLMNVESILPEEQVESVKSVRLGIERRISHAMLFFMGKDTEITGDAKLRLVMFQRGLQDALTFTARAFAAVNLAETSSVEGTNTVPTAAVD